MNPTALLHQIESAKSLDALPLWFWTGVVVIALWDLAWKGIALWKAGRNNQLAWFIPLLIINSAGILPIVYILGFQKKR